MEKSVCRTAILAMLGALPVWAQTAPPIVDPESQSAFLDSTSHNLDELEGTVRKSLLGGGTKPVSFAGEAVFRFIGTTFEEYPYWMATDRTESKNSFASLRLAMVAAPHKNLRLWTKIAFNSALYGTNAPVTLGNSSGGTQKYSTLWVGNNAYQTSPSTGFFDPHSNNLFEDMCAGLTASVGQATTSFKLGGPLWTEASPLTVWRAQNRLFGWDYVPYELEQPPAQYYEYATSKGERTGRAAWNKKPFQGFQWESIDLPGKLYFEMTYGDYEGFMKWQPNLPNTDNSNGMMYKANPNNAGDSVGDMTFAQKGTGVGDGYHKAFVGRLAVGEIPLPGGQALPVMSAINYVNYHTDDDFAKQYRYALHWGGLANADDAAPLAAYTGRGSKDTGRFINNYFLSSQVASVDFRQNVPGKVSFLVDFAMSQVDTSFFKVQDSGPASTKPIQILRYGGVADSLTILNAEKYEVLAHRKSSWTPAIYGQASNLLSATIDTRFPVDLGIQAVFAPKKFFSGTSFVMPADIFFPYEANLVGAGKFAGADGGTPYAANMTGANFTVKYTQVPNGHLRMNVGYHTQIEDGSDMIFLPWRLNGTAFKLAQNQSSTQYGGSSLTDDYLRGNAGYEGAKTAGLTPENLRQIRRFGEEFFAQLLNPDGSNRRNPYAPTAGLAGGIRNDFLSTFEGFGAFRLRRDSSTFAKDTAAINHMRYENVMPQSQKATMNLSLDYGQDISGLWAGSHPLFLGIYGALNGVSKGGIPLPSDDKTLLSGYLLRFEPVFQVTDRFWLIALAGQERWYSRFGVAAIDSVSGLASIDDEASDPRNWHSAPIDYTDWSFGGGFDWGLSPRVELHTRLQYFTHRDDGVSKEVAAAKGKNDFSAWYLHAETKMWF